MLLPNTINEKNASVKGMVFLFVGISNLQYRRNPCPLGIVKSDKIFLWRKFPVALYENFLYNDEKRKAAPRR